MFNGNIVIFYVFFAIAVFLEIAFVSNTGSEIDKKNKNMINITLFVFLLLIASLRSPYTGMDTAGYYFKFRSFLRSSKGIDFFFSEIIDAFKYGNYHDGLMWDLCSKLLSLVIPNPQIWMALISSIFLSSAFFTIRKYSNEPVISWVYLVSIYILIFILQGLRQSVAMSLILLSYNHLHKNNLKMFLLFVGLAYLFHQSSAVFVIVYPLRKFKPTKNHIIVLVCTFFLVKFIPSITVDVLSFFATNSRFETYLSRSGMYTLSGAYVLGAIYLFCYKFKDELIEVDEKNQLLFVLSLLGVISQICSVVVAEMFRVSLYFSMFNMLLVANTMTIIDKKVISVSNKVDRNTYRLILVAVFALYFSISTDYHYRFFWR